MKKIAVAGLLTAMMGVASAQVYVGGVIGQSHVNLDCADYDRGCDKSDTGHKLYFGYKLNPAVALEAAYVNFGKGTRAYTGSYYDGSVLRDIRVEESIEATGALIAAAFRYAAHPQLSLVGRLGLSILKTRYEEAARFTTYNSSQSDDSVKPYVGLGLEFAVNKNLRITADADFTTAELNGDSGAVRLLGVGLQYAF